MKSNFQKGFTLIELLVVIAIIGLLATMSVVSFSTSREKARISKGSAYEGQVLRSVGDDLVGRWDFDDCSGGSTVDSSGYNSNGTISGATWSTDVPSNQGCSLTFNGTTNSISMPDSGIFDMASFTLSAWVKTSGIVGRGRIVSQQATDYWGMALNGNALEFLSSRDAVLVAKGPALNDNKWHQVVVVRDAGKNLYWYVDGSQVGIQAITDAGTYSIASNIYIGTFAGANFFSGNIDNVRVFRRSLMSQEIHQMYAEGLPRHLAEK